jgi:hypothetical protein
MVGENAQLAARKKSCTHLMAGEFYKKNGGRKNGSTEMHLNAEFAFDGRLKKIGRKKICSH